MGDAANFGELLDLTDHEMGDGKGSVTLEVQPKHLNLGGIVHGGVLASLLDMALGIAVVSTLDRGDDPANDTGASDSDVGPDEWCATQSLNTEFLRPASEGTLVAEGHVERRGRTAAFPVGRITDEEGRVVARATGVWAIRRGSR